jgi:hypothetical protein
LKSKPTTEKPAPKPEKPKSYIEEQRALYLSSKKFVPASKDKRKIDESDILAQLQSFSKRIRTAVEPSPAEKPAPKGAVKGEGEDEERCALHNRANCASCKRGDAPRVMDEGFGGEEEDDEGWLGHALVFDKETGVRDIFKPEDYEFLDPRDNK